VSSYLDQYVKKLTEPAHRYLTKSSLFQIGMENCKLAILCLRYLTFECFDSELSELKTSEFLMGGYYAFQDYAALHWVDHLVCYVDAFCASSSPHSDDLGGAIEDFFMVYGAGESKRDDVDRELEKKCALTDIPPERPPRLNDHRFTPKSPYLYPS
jgi:hypothetical protein